MSLVSRFFRVLSKPHLIPSKLLSKIELYNINSSYDESRYISEQVKLFKEMDLDYLASIDILNDLYKNDSRVRIGKASCHHNLFVALSKKYNFSNILEIGTHKGTCTILLSKIFPNAKITTIDLPDHYKVVHGKGADFIKQRNDLLASCPNIEFKQENSLDLISNDKKYDLIFVDGDHVSPVATADIVNSVRMINEGGFIVCDDVYISEAKNYIKQWTVDSFSIINALSNAKLINYSLILKRTNKPWAHPKLRKYVAILTKK
jgi:predicted O-methyltransferase YrrM